MRARRRSLVVLPDADRVEHALLEAAQAETFVDGRGFTTFGRLVELCEPAKHLGRRLCPELTARMVLSACAAKLERHPFGGWVREPGFAREARSLVAALKSQRMAPADLAHAARALTDATARGRALALAELWKAYEAGLAQLELADREDLAAAATAALERGLPPALGDFSSITVRHLYDWPPLRLGLVTALARACERAKVAFSLELPRASDPQVDALTDEAFGALERGGAEDVGFAAAVELPATDAHRWAIQRLFGVGAELNPSAQGFSAFSTATALDEHREIARRVREALDAGASPDGVAVAFRELAGDAEAAVAALAEKGVAARTRRGVPVASTALGRLALELPRLVEDSFPSGQLAHFLESRYVTATRTESDPEPLFRAAGLRDDLLGAQGERGAYEVRLLALAGRSSGELKQRARALAREVKQFIALCQPLARARTSSEQLAAWTALVKALGLVDGVGRGEAVDGGAPALARAAERALAQDQAAAQAVERLGETLAQALEQSRAGRATASLGTFARWLADAAADLNLDARGARAGAVQVLDLRELLGRRLSHLFVGGLVDGRLPSRPQAASLLSDAAKVALNKAGGRPLFRVRAGEGGDRLLTREAEDRLLFVHALCAAPSVTLSHARLDAEGRSALASPWVHGLTHGDFCVPLQRLALSAAPPLDRVHAPRELKLRVALEALCDERTRLSPRDPAAPLFAQRFEQEQWFQAARDVARIEAERFTFFEKEEAMPGRHSGGLFGPALLPILRLRLAFGPEQPVSGSALKAWGNCAFAGFAGQLLGLKAPEVQGEEWGSSERGTFLHAVMEALLPRLKVAGLLGKEKSPALLEQLAPHLDAAIEVAAEETGRRHALGNPVLWDLARATARRAALRMVLGEGALPFAGAEPREVELRFGAEGEGLGPVAFPAALEGETDVYLRGKIDRVDAGEGLVGVLDYKSTVRQPKELRAEFLKSEFQLPLYLHVLKQREAKAELAAAWQSFKDGKVTRLDKAVEEKLDLGALLATSRAEREGLEANENLGNALHSLLARLRAGQFGPRPLDCKHCDFERVCRISDRRLEGEGETDGA